MLQRRMMLGLAVAAMAAGGSMLGQAWSAPGSPARTQPAASRVTIAPPTGPGVLPGWAPGLDNAVAGIKPLCMNLWETDAPGQIKDPPHPERNDGERIWEVSIPGMIVYLPPREKLAAAGGTCLVECMGGSYTHLTRLVGADHTVESLAPRGIAIVSLKYRLKPPSVDPERDAVADGMRAMRQVRAHAAEWGIDPHKVGMLGWSAGGNLIVSLCSHMQRDGAGDPAAADPVERQSCRPDFAVLWSPWPNARKAEDYVPEHGVSFPPAMIGGAEDDKTAPFPFVTGIKDRWIKAGASAEFIVMPAGGHGSFELGAGSAGDWTTKLLPWMAKEGMWKDAPAPRP